MPAPASIIPADSPEAAALLDAPPGAPGVIPVDSPVAGTLLDAPPPAAAPTSGVIPVDSPVTSQLLDHKDYLAQLPRDAIVTDYLEKKKSGVPVNEADYKAAYLTRVREGNLLGDKNLTPGAPAGPSLLESTLDTAKSLDVGFLSQLNEFGKTAFGVDFATGRGIKSTWHGPAPDDSKLLSPDERRNAFANLIQGSELAGVRTVNMLRQASINVANYLFRHNNAIADAQGINNEAPDAATEKAAAEQFAADVAVRHAEERILNGGSLFTPEAQQKLGIGPTKALPSDAATVEDVSQSPLSDPTFLAVSALGAKGAMKAAREFTSGAEAASKGLFSIADGKEVLGFDGKKFVATTLDNTVAKPLEIAANGARKTADLVDQSPIARAAIAGGATVALGGNAPLAIFNGLLASTSHTELVKGALSGVEKGLRGAANKFAGRAELGPFAKSAAVIGSQLGEEGLGYLLAQAPNVPFLFGSENRDQAKNLAIVGVLAHGAGKSVGWAANGLNVAQNFWAPDRSGIGEPRLPVKDLGVSPELDAAHAETMANINDSGSNFVEKWRQFAKSTGLGEVYMLSKDNFKKALLQMSQLSGKSVEELTGGTKLEDVVNTRGFTVGEIPGEKGLRKIAIAVVEPGIPGLGFGHELGHLIILGMSDEQRAGLFDSLEKDLGPDQLDAFRRRYAQDIGRDPSTVSKDDALHEYGAETASAVVNSLPVSQSGPLGAKGWNGTVRKVYSAVGQALRQAGFNAPKGAERIAQTDPEGNVSHVWGDTNGSVVTGLGAEPSIPGARLIENFLQARALDRAAFSAEADAPQTTKASPIADVQEVAPEPRFKKEDPIGDVTGSDGTIIASDAKVTKVLGDKDGVHYYQISYTDPADGKRKLGTVPEHFLYSPVNEAGKPAPKQSGPAHPVTSESHVGAESLSPHTATDLVTPAHVQNVTKPEAVNVHVTPAQQAAFAAKAAPDVVAHNTSVIKAATDLPTNQKPAVETDYYSAKGETGEDATVREQRRKLADAAEKTGKPNPLRAIYQKIFVPYRYIEGKTPRVFGFSYDKLIQNVDILKGWAQANGRPDVAATVSNPQFANQVRVYLKNQSNGFGGGGETIVTPKDARPGTVTPPTPGFVPEKLPANVRDTINLLMGVELPQNSSPASQFAARMARENGLTPTVNDAGVEITNPLYAELTQEGFDPKLLNSTVENLPVDRMTTKLKPRPDVKVNANDLAITRAGFMPGARPSGASPDLPVPKKGLFEERAPRVRAAEDEFSRHSSYVDGLNGGAVLHSAKLRSAAFLSPDKVADFKSEINAAKTPEAKDHVIESYFMPAKLSDFTSGGQKTVEEAMRQPGWAILTGTQEKYGDHTHSRNVAANEELSQKLDREGIPHAVVSGNYKGVDQGTNELVILPRDEALKLGRQFGQDTVLTNEGLVSSKPGTLGKVVAPTDHSQNLFGEAAKAQDFHSVLPNGLPVSQHLDFRPLAPVEYAGFQQGAPGQKGFHLWNLTQDIPGHPEGSTVSTPTLEAAGFRGPTFEEFKRLNHRQFSSAGRRLDEAAAQLGEKGRAMPGEYSVGGELKLVHYGSQGQKTADPAHFGSSGLTNKSELSGLPRSYFYEQGKVNKSDPAVGRNAVHGATVDGGRIYDGDADPLGHADMINREKADQMLVDAGYAGIARTGGSGKNKYRQVELFQPTKLQALKDANVRFLPAPSPAQEKAFKDSTVRDENGNLKPVFHGTYSDFKKFGKGDLGYHFGTEHAANARIGKSLADLNPEVSAEDAFAAFPEMRENMPPGARGAIEGLADGARTLPVYLDIKNPLRMKDVGPWDNPEEVLFALPKSVLQRLPKSVGDAVDAYVAQQNDYAGPAKKYNDFKERTAKPALQAIREGLKKLGYDGIVYRNEFEGVKHRDADGFPIPAYEKSPGPDSYIAFDNKQIMPAFSHDAKGRMMPAKRGETPDVKESRTFKAIAKNLTPKEQDKMRSDTAQDMVDLYKSLPKDEEFETASKLGAAKLGWYKRAAESIRYIFGDDTERFVGLLAAMSPQQPVAENLHMSLKVWADWQDAGRPTDTQSLKDIIGKHAELHSRIDNSVRALQGHEMSENKPSKFLEEGAHLSGLKVESFRRNLLGDFSPSTNDTWMAMFANLDPKVFGTKSGYLAYNAKIRKVAEKLGLQPAEVQETVWSFFKTLRDSTSVSRSAHEVLQTLSDSDILKAPEFHDELLHNPKIRLQLDRLGFTGLDALADRESAQKPAPRKGSLADLAVQEGGERGRRVLGRIADRAQSLKDLEVANTKKALAPDVEEENPF